MQEYTFPAWCYLGETEVEVELTDEEAKLLERLGRNPDIFYDGFSECEELKDLYNKIYAIAVKQMTEEIRDFGDDDHADDPDWVVDDTYACGVEFPSEFEDMLIEEE
jgi:hypothetical protein